MNVDIVASTQLEVLCFWMVSADARSAASADSVARIRSLKCDSAPSISTAGRIFTITAATWCVVDIPHATPIEALCISTVSISVKPMPTRGPRESRRPARAVPAHRHESVQREPLGCAAWKSAERTGPHYRALHDFSRGMRLECPAPQARRTADIPQRDGHESRLHPTLTVEKHSSSRRFGRRLSTSRCQRRFGRAFATP
ncbi:hypothetical protein KDW49_08100 [Burkholderia dolosa]|uniref:hypothetical protein n=1 Tax=Burkholderia dolosa TaxID=152500 RepID=UPI001B93E268|nr:hypothetical protein [Burkholderia dolosa]MBR8300674.1 hypothetical protein [Burkholderia dolosa]